MTSNIATAIFRSVFYSSMVCFVLSSCLFIACGMAYLADMTRVDIALERFLMLGAILWIAATMLFVGAFALDNIFEARFLSRRD